MSVVKYGDRDVWFDLFKKSTSLPYTEKLQILSSLIYTNQTDLLQLFGAF
jgi:hypothetical protein